jgi:hypothetical protein
VLRPADEPDMKTGFSTGSYVLSKVVSEFVVSMSGEGRPMAEFMRSMTIVCMGLTVIGAGVFVVFYG